MWVLECYTLNNINALPAKDSDQTRTILSFNTNLNWKFQDIFTAIDILKHAYCICLGYMVIAKAPISVNVLMNNIITAACITDKLFKCYVKFKILKIYRILLTQNIFFNHLHFFLTTFKVVEQLLYLQLNICKVPGIGVIVYTL